MIYAIISDGRLYVGSENGPTQEIESRFVAEKNNLAERSKKNSGWKTGTSPEDLYFNKSAIWGQQNVSGTVGGYRFKKVMSAGETGLYYTLANNTVTGLFRYDFSDKFETRLFHRNELIECGIDFCPARKEFVMAVLNTDMSSNLQLLNESGSILRDVTTGDARDSYPVFSRRHPDHILYQSAGIARDEMGVAIMHGPEAIFRLDLQNEQVEEVLSDEQFDFLLPREDESGNLYFIRRPYRHPGQNGIWRLLLDIVLFPFHFAVAIVGFLDAFTKLFNQQTLANSMRGSLPRQDKYVHVLGQSINLAKLRRNSLFRGEPNLVPGNWELIRMTPDKQFQVLARHVLSYDIDAAGQVHYTNGYRVRRLSQTDRKIMLNHRVIEQLTISRGKRMEIQS